MKRTLRNMLPVLAIATSLTTIGLALSPLAAAPFQTSTKKPTSDDQKNNKADVELTAKIRKAIMDDKTLSTAAHNVKIISQNGKVTLRGAVKTQDEKDNVVAKAKDIAGADNVTSHVTVSPAKPKKTTTN